MVSGSLALLYFLLGFHGGRQGSGPDRSQSPVEWGDFPSVRTFVCPSPPLGHPAIHPSVRPAINQRGLIAGQSGLKNNWRGLRVIHRTEGKLEGSEDQPKGV